MTTLPALPAHAVADLVDSMPIPVILCGADGLILHVSPAVTETFGLPAGGHPWRGLTFADLPLQPAASVSDVAAKIFTYDDGEVTPARFRKSSSTIGGDGPAAIAVHFLMPVLASAVDVLHPLGALGGRSANLDRESGLQDRAAISHVLHSEVARCRRYGNPLSVIMIWMDAAGGAGLDDPDSLSAPAVLGQMLAEQTRWADATGRWATACFLLVLPETNLVAAEFLCDKIRASVVDMQRRGVVFDLRLSASEWARGDDARTLLKRAEAGVEVPALEASA